ncbi:MAG: hypothetical protein BroJett011_24530 [Chloroflexota bacterium]|nr:MAG: hypothetical protein BroJett011_24530 [Chloroflexota bacterium]
MTRTRPIPALTIPRLLVAILFIAIFTMAVRLPADTDTWWHLRSGQYIVENGVVPTTDPFSHTKAGQPWIDHGWLAQLFWYGLFALGGLPGLSLGLALLVTFTFWLVWQVTPGNLYVRAFTMVLGAVTSAVIWVARPQMVSFLLAGLVLFLLEKYKREGRRWIYALPLVTLLWVNIHGGYAIAFMLLGVYIVGEIFNNLTRHSEDPLVPWPRLGPLLVVGAVSFAVVVINPHGWQMWLYPFHTVGIGALRDFIQEWRSPDFHLSLTWAFLAMLLLSLAALGRAGRRADWTDLAMWALWTFWSLFAARNIGLYGLLTIPALARYADAAWGQYLPGERKGNSWELVGTRDSASVPSVPTRSFSSTRLNWVLLGLVLFAALVKIGVALNPQEAIKAEQEGLPAKAVRFIQENKPAGPLFNSYNWGGYLIYKLWPAYPVYIDGRTDLYDDAFIRRYLDTVAGGEGWQQVLDEDGINLVLIESGSTLAKFLKSDPVWQELYHDEMASIFARSPTTTRSGAE